MGLVSKYDLPIVQTHCAETATENAQTRAHQRAVAAAAGGDLGAASDSETSIDFLARVGFLGPRSSCAHAIWVTPRCAFAVEEMPARVQHPASASG
jgi:cytosine/adenosine deaminase-related metal-dependent hydrolase